MEASLKVKILFKIMATIWKIVCIVGCQYGTEYNVVVNAYAIQHAQFVIEINKWEHPFIIQLWKKIWLDKEKRSLYYFNDTVLIPKFLFRHFGNLLWSYRFSVLSHNFTFKKIMFLYFHWFRFNIMEIHNTRHLENLYFQTIFHNTTRFDNHNIVSFLSTYMLK